MLTIHHNYSLLVHNSFGIDVKAKEFVEYQSVADLQDFLRQRSADMPILHIGGGNNLLFTSDYEGTILHSAIKGVEVVSETDSEVIVRVGAAEVWDEFVAEMVSRGMYGLENLSLIPSEVGAAAVQNIGAYGAEAKDFITQVEVVNLDNATEECFSQADCDFAYRYSNFKGPWKGRYAVTYVSFRLNKAFVPNLSYKALAQLVTPEIDANALRDKVVDVRNGKLPDPKVLGNAGSFFMNPVISEEHFKTLQQQYPDIPHYAAPNGVKVPAGWLIDQCGWKGRALGRAAVYEKQALVIVNLGGATPQDIMRLSDAVCADVKSKFGIDIHPEVNWI